MQIENLFQPVDQPSLSPVLKVTISLQEQQSLAHQILIESNPAEAHAVLVDASATEWLGSQKTYRTNV